VVSVSESGGSYPVPPPMPMMMEARAQAADTKIDPGEQKLQVNLAMVFELQCMKKAAQLGAARPFKFDSNRASSGRCPDESGSQSRAG